MIYYILLLAIVFLSAIIKPQRSQSAKKKFVLLSFTLLIALAGFRSPEVGRDVAGHYAANYEVIGSLRWSELLPYSVAGGYEIGYCYFNKLVAMLTGSDVQWFLFVTSFFIYGAFGLLIYKKSPDAIMSILLLLFSCQYYMYMNVLRQAMALSIILLGWLLSQRMRKRTWATVCMLASISLAMTFHTSAVFCVVMAIFPYLKFNKATYTMCIVFAVVFFVSFSIFYNEALSLLGAGNKYEMYEGFHSDAQGYVTIATVTNALLTFGAFLSLKYIGLSDSKQTCGAICQTVDRKEIDFLLYASFFAGLFRLMTLQMNILNRFSLYFVPFILLAYPMAFVGSKGKTATVKHLVLLLFFVYFFFTTERYAAELYGVIPYKFGL